MKIAFRETEYYKNIALSDEEAGLYVKVGLYIDIVWKMKDHFELPKAVLAENPCWWFSLEEVRQSLS